MFRSHTCGELRITDVSNPVTLAGWVQTIRKFGSITFVDLRDRYGITQLLFGDQWNDRLGEEPLGREFVIQVSGVVTERSNKNKNIQTGDIEIEIQTCNILNKSAVPPFTIQDDTDGGDDLRMKYRYLDLRRNTVKKNLELRYAVSRATRNYLHAQGFIDIETPFLIKSTPEGARDFVVPSRMNEGQYYALPQSPQTFKQLLMVSGFDRYYQIVKCFRDEDLRADRQPEFTQIDCEMAFVEQEDILQMFEGMVKSIFKEVKGKEYTEPVERMTWEDAIWNYGNDKPDIRFEIKVANLKVPPYSFSNRSADTLWNRTAKTFDDKNNLPVISNSTLAGKFKIFDEAETILAIAIPGAAAYTRKQIDDLTDWVKRPQVGMQGMVIIRWNDDETVKSSADKFFNEEELRLITQFSNASKGDLILILAGTEDKTRKAISELRLELAQRLGLRKKDEFKLLWVIDFPLFEYSEQEIFLPPTVSQTDALLGYPSMPSLENFSSQIKIGRWMARHHPFTSPKPEQINLMVDTNPHIEKVDEYLKHPYATIKANAYDMVMNGNEIGGGSIRIHQRELQEKMFAALGMSEEEASQKFGFLLSAFEYGAPPHGGIAFGFDRLCAILGGSESIRDFIAFPKNNSGRDVMLDAPSNIDDDQLSELGIRSVVK